MTTILGSRKSRTTAKAIAVALNASYRESGPVNEFTIRYGNSYTRDPEEGNILNKQHAVITSSNKPVCKKLLMDNNIPTPRLLSYDDNNIRFPVIVRKNNHFKGKYFHVCNNNMEILRYGLSNHYIQEMVTKIDEFRLFIMNDRIIEANIKRCPTPNIMIRNKENGCYFARVRVSELPTNLKNAAREAIKKIGLDFGAVDCATIQESPGITIFEVNSAPGLIPRKVDLFVEKLKEYEYI